MVITLLARPVGPIQQCGPIVESSKAG
jgi:hypothetical protein